MKRDTNHHQTPIKTIRVYSKNQQVFIKNRNENWLPISFRWIQSCFLES